MAEVIVTTPVRKLEVFVDESTNPPTLHLSMPYPASQADKNLWVVRQVLKRLEHECTPRRPMALVGG